MTETDAPARPRILIVDDALTVRLFCNQLLTEAGFDVAEAINGLEGLEIALQGAFDLFLVDINMQKMDGYAMLRRLRQEPALRDVPAVMISTESKDSDRENALLAGANWYFVKPVRPDDLTAAARLLTGRGAGQSGGQGS